MDASFKVRWLMVYVEKLGEKAETGSKLSVHYKAGASDFTKFDSSID